MSAYNNKSGDITTVSIALKQVKVVGGITSTRTLTLKTSNTPTIISFNLTSQINTTNDPSKTNNHNNNNQGITIIIFATAIVAVLLFGAAIYKIHKPVANVKYPGSFIYNSNRKSEYRYI